MTNRKLSVAMCAECGDPVLAKGLCSKHYRRQALLAAPPCAVEGCLLPAASKKMCQKHYIRLKKYGDVTYIGKQWKLSLEDRFWQYADKSGECWLWTANKSNKGYGFFQMEGKNRAAHRVAFYLTHGAWPVLDVLHSCDVPACVNPAHLREGTHRENMIEMHMRNRAAIRLGEANAASKLSNRDVLAIKARLELGEPSTRLAEEFSVDKSSINNIRRGKTWKHISSGNPAQEVTL